MWQHQGSELIFDVEDTELLRELVHLACMPKEGYMAPLQSRLVVGLLFEENQM